MKKLLKLVDSYQTLVFLDLEGTQFSHEMIALGAVKVRLHKNKTIKRFTKSMKVCVKPHEKIGRIVENLTKITPEIIEKEGISYKDALVAFKKFCGRDFTKTLFVTFGSHDIRILNQSLLHSKDASSEIVHQISKSHLDLSQVLSEYVRDENSNTYSLVNFLSLFGKEFEGEPHDCLQDAINLAYLYNEALKQPKIIFEKYVAWLEKYKKMPRPIIKIVQKISKDRVATYEDFKEFAYEEIAAPVKKKKSRR